MTKISTSTAGQFDSLEKPSYKVRLAKTKDWDQVGPMCKSFYQFSPYASLIEYDEETTKEQFYDLVETGGAVVLGLMEEKVVGMLGFIVSPFVTNKNVIMGTEMFWWVEPEHRGTLISKELVETAEVVAKIAYGCHFFAMSKLSNSPKMLDRWYRHRGYSAEDQTYLKEL